MSDFEVPLPDGVAGTPTPWPGGGYMYRPGEVLAAPGELDHVREHVEALHGTTSVEDLSLPDLVRVRVDVDVPELIRRMRNVEHDVLPMQVSPNHVMHEFSHLRFFSRLPPTPAGDPLPDLVGRRGKGIRVAVIDSGAWNHDWYGKRVDRVGNGEEPDENNNGQLDICGGHGTFVCGVVLQHAPRATVVARRIPDRLPDGTGRTGLVDDVQLAGMIDAIDDDIDIVNLSLGAWTEGDLAPPATAAALARLRARNRNCVVVAAAGNEATTRPIWPAAFKGVIAVGALAATGEMWENSARGWWVDAWADGVDVCSTFFEWNGPMEHPDGVNSEFAQFAIWTGTSFAAPRVVGAIAAKAKRPGGARRAARKLLASGTPLAGEYGVVVTTPTFF